MINMIKLGHKLTKINSKNCEIPMNNKSKINLNYLDRLLIKTHLKII